MTDVTKQANAITSLHRVARQDKQGDGKVSQVPRD